MIAPLSLFDDDRICQDIVSHLDWDMVIIDEAHHLTGLGETRSEFGQFIHDLSARSRGLLLLSATPEQAGLRNHFDRLQLIDPARFADFDQFIEEHHQFATWSAKIEALEAGEDVALPPGIDATADTDSKIEQMLDRYGTSRILYRNTRRGVTGFPARHRYLYPLDNPTLYQQSTQQLHPELGKLESEWVTQDPQGRLVGGTVEVTATAKGSGHLCSQRNCRGVGALSSPQSRRPLRRLP